MDRIKLFVCCHQPSRVPEHPLLVPVQVGAALAQERFPGFRQDDAGENISDKNRSYCELTAQYWAWKNVDADYYGFFHYRRYLYPDAAERRPYRLAGTPSEALLDELGYDGFSAWIEDCDLVVPKPEEMHISVRGHYAAAPFHHKRDLELAEEIVRRRYPDFVPAMNTYFAGTAHYFGNICIMKRQVFRDYCAWLFPVLEEFDRLADVSGYGPQERRVNGYLAERLLGVYCTHVKAEGTLRVRELPRVHFVPDDAARHKKQLELALLPAGSRRRAWIKSMVRRGD